MKLPARQEVQVCVASCVGPLVPRAASFRELQRPLAPAPQIPSFFQPRLPPGDQEQEGADCPSQCSLTYKAQGAHLHKGGPASGPHWLRQPLGRQRIRILGGCSLALVKWLFVVTGRFYANIETVWWNG